MDSIGSLGFVEVQYLTQVRADIRYTLRRGHGEEGINGNASGNAQVGKTGKNKIRKQREVDKKRNKVKVKSAKGCRLVQTWEATSLIHMVL